PDLVQDRSRRARACCQDVPARPLAGPEAASHAVLQRRQNSREPHRACGPAAVSDDSVHAALRSDAKLVVVEAPAGCGKTHQGADYARDVAATSNHRPLILTHTHAACSVFAE